MPNEEKETFKLLNIYSNYIGFNIFTLIQFEYLNVQHKKKAFPCRICLLLIIPLHNAPFPQFSISCCDYVVFAAESPV